MRAWGSWWGRCTDGAGTGEGQEPHTSCPAWGSNFQAAPDPFARSEGLPMKREQLPPRAGLVGEGELRHRRELHPREFAGGVVERRLDPVALVVDQEVDGFGGGVLWQLQWEVDG